MGGFAVTSLGAVLSAVAHLTSGDFASGALKGELESLLYPASSMAAVFAWWFLSKVFVNGAEQRKLVLFALLGLAVQGLLLSTLDFIIFLPLTVLTTNWGSTVNTLEPYAVAVGSALTTIGFAIMAITYPHHLDAEGLAADAGTDPAMEVTT